MEAFGFHPECRRSHLLAAVLLTEGVGRLSTESGKAGAAGERLARVVTSLLVSKDTLDSVEVTGLSRALRLQS